MDTDLPKPSIYGRLLFFLLVRVVVLLMLGLNVRKKGLLPKKGPAIIVANHNSHLDTLVLISLFPLKDLRRIRPVAAADYFMSNRLLAWFSTSIIGIIPIRRGKAGKQEYPLHPCCEAVEEGCIMIFFPEGTRGEPERISHFKKGIIHLAERYPHVPITPVFMHGLGKALPKGDFVLVPFFCDVFVSEPLFFGGDRQMLMRELNERFHTLASQEHFSVWD